MPFCGLVCSWCHCHWHSLDVCYLGCHPPEKQGSTEPLSHPLTRNPKQLFIIIHFRREWWLKRSIIVMLQILWQMTVFACNHNFRVATVGMGTPTAAHITQRPLQRPPFAYVRITCSPSSYVSFFFPWTKTHTPRFLMLLLMSCLIILIWWQFWGNESWKKLHFKLSWVVSVKSALGPSADFKDAHTTHHTTHHTAPSAQFRPPTRYTNSLEENKTYRGTLLCRAEPNFCL